MNVSRLALRIISQPERMAIRIKRLLAYMRRFGTLRGPRLLFKVLTAKQATFEVRIPQARHPITLRTGTSDLATFEQIFVWEDYDLPLSEAPETIIDGGANIGCATVYFANRFPNARIIAVEPDETNFEMLTRNASPYANVSLMRAGIWHQRAWLKIENPEDEKWMLRVCESESADGAIAALTIPDILAEAGASSLDLLKLDIEGAEREVFANGDRQWLAQVKALVIELHDHYKPGCSAAFYGATATYNFSQTEKGEHVTLISRQPAHVDS
jgi:FkbM family methyltransferase